MTAERQRLWDFALGFYAASGVGEACLTLQDECGVDVPVLLFSAWLSKHSVALTEAELVRIDGVVADWRDEVVKPLRSVRRRLKSGPQPAPNHDTEALRNGLKGIELGSEKIEMAVLEAEGEALIAAGGAPVDAADNLALVLRHFHAAGPNPKTVEALAAIGEALAAF
ncbi:TIGR02444 family protein (plasmid) [Sinorhizobium meliloti]|uniref:TIGR02444 family protein n=1 Tax=Rhizobium meliloti TaxID=382 RepID=UPI002D795BCF|nr:TIGR02444 family protein [Sinorhizobium meliloti]WRQ70143.1 TIGR02444 family protein [Sinorhizobium meliloti]